MGVCVCVCVCVVPPPSFSFSFCCFSVSRTPKVSLLPWLMLLSCVQVRRGPKESPSDGDSRETGEKFLGVVLLEALSQRWEWEGRNRADRRSVGMACCWAPFFSLVKTNKKELLGDSALEFSVGGEAVWRAG
mmetsp:Transcript_28626/g.56069  ORF Transcript_28626/g.56069 Transcript_28626/m.56069 type:complete len:132 (+) Transcript_28626:2-397(+)